MGHPILSELVPGRTMCPRKALSAWYAVPGLRLPFPDCAGSSPASRWAAVACSHSPQQPCDMSSHFPVPDVSPTHRKGGSSSQEASYCPVGRYSRAVALDLSPQCCHTAKSNQLLPSDKPCLSILSLFVKGGVFKLFFFCVLLLMPISIV